MIIRIVAIGFTAFLAWIIHEANTGSHNIIIDTVDTIPNGDKLGHFFMMGMFAYLVNLMLECKTFKIGRLDILKGSAIVLVCVVLEEITHMFIRTRTFSYFDLLSDLLGIIAFSYLAIKTFPIVSRMLNKPKHPPGIGTSAS